MQSQRKYEENNYYNDILKGFEIQLSDKVREILIGNFKYSNGRFFLDTEKIKLSKRKNIIDKPLETKFKNGMKNLSGYCTFKIPGYKDIYCILCVKFFGNSTDIMLYTMTKKHIDNAYFWKKSEMHDLEEGQQILDITRTLKSQGVDLEKFKELAVDFLCKPIKLYNPGTHEVPKSSEAIAETLNQEGNGEKIVNTEMLETIKVEDLNREENT